MDLWMSSSEERSGLNMNLAYGWCRRPYNVKVHLEQEKKDKTHASKKLHNIEIRQRRNSQSEDI